MQSRLTQGRVRVMSEGSLDLIRARRRMLDKVGAVPSTDALDARREAGDVFAVRDGDRWLYPRFQLDADGGPIAEMKAVLAALPDDAGWDRLQWFLTPHETLEGRTPLEVWRDYRWSVMRAAATERWTGRD